jgi:glucan phosphoethanolaminetransferase (alkaline phosphatase superfamily)
MDRNYFWILVLLYFSFFIIYSYLHYVIWRVKTLPPYIRKITFGIDIILLFIIGYWIVTSYQQSTTSTIQNTNEDLLPAHWDTSAHMTFQTENEALLQRQLAPPQIKDPRLRNHYIEETKQAYEQLAEFNEMRL